MRLFLFTLPEKLIYFVSMILSVLINGKKNLRTIPFKNILCIKEDEIGDLCYSLHVFEMLRRQFPDAKISLLCKPFAVSLTNGNLHLTHVTSNWNDLTGNYDLIVDMRGSWRSNWYAFRCWPKARLDRGTVRFINKKAGSHPHEVLTNLQLVKPVISEQNQNTSPRIEIRSAEHSKVEDFLMAHHIQRYALLHPGARKELRRWNQYDLLATWLKKEKGLDVIIAGDNGEKAAIAELQAKIPVKTYSIAGEFSLSGLAAMASRAQVFIGNESGPLHIASVTGAPSLGLYGPGEPVVFYPWGPDTDYLHVVLECNPCDQVHCVHPENPCITRIALTDVVQKVENLLKLKH